jgi:hypothetical protein
MPYSSFQGDLDALMSCTALPLKRRLRDSLKTMVGPGDAEGKWSCEIGLTLVVYAGNS